MRSPKAAGNLGWVKGPILHSLRKFRNGREMKGRNGKNALNVQKTYFAITFVKIHDNLDMSGQNKHTLVKHLTSYIVLRCQKLMVAGAETKVLR